jgi:hypothetical protein
LIQVRRYLFTHYTLETLLNHVFEDLRKPKAPNNNVEGGEASLIEGNLEELIRKKKETAIILEDSEDEEEDNTMLQYFNDGGDDNNDDMSIEDEDEDF